MTEYDYSPDALERYLATQTRIARWVDETEQHRPQFQHAVHQHHREPSRRHRPSQIYVQPPAPPPTESSSSSSEDNLPPLPVSAPAMYPAQPQARYSAPPPPPPMMQMVYPTPSPQRSPYYAYPAGHHRTPSRSHTVRSSHHTSSHHSPAYYNMAPSPQVSPPYSHPQQFIYSPPPSATQHPHPGYLIAVPQHHHPKPPHQPVVVCPYLLSL